MRNPFGGPGDASGSSFLPEDYIEKKADRRANVIYLSLFSVVILGVVGAFFVTNQQWTSVKRHQEAINVRYTQAAKDIEQLKVLEKQKEQMLGKAELTTSLLEKAPRSLLMAELINRMPDRLTLLEFELEAKAGEPARVSRPAPVAGRTQGKSLASKADAAEAETAPRAPVFDTKVAITGVAATHNSVAQYVSALQMCELLEHVELKFSEVTIIDDRELTKFRIEAKLRPNADARTIEPAQPRAGAFGEAKRTPEELQAQQLEKESGGVGDAIRGLWPGKKER